MKNAHRDHTKFMEDKPALCRNKIYYEKIRVTEKSSWNKKIIYFRPIKQH